MNQVTILRKLTPQKRLLQALYLSDFVRELVVKGVRKEEYRGRPRAARHSHHLR